MGQRSGKSKVAHGEVKKCKILGLLCAEDTFGKIWRPCRRRANLAVGDAACDNLKWLVETTKPKRGVYSQAILQWQGGVFILTGRYLFRKFWW